MVKHARWDIEWRADDSDKISGCLVYSDESQLNRDLEARVPIRRIEVVGRIDPEVVINNSGDFEYRGMSVEEALQEAVSMQGDFLVGGTWEGSYWVYKEINGSLAVDSSMNNGNAQGIRTCRITKGYLVEPSSLKTPVSNVEIICAIPKIDFKGEKVRRKRAVDIAESVGGVFMGIPKCRSRWEVYRYKQT